MLHPFKLEVREREGFRPPYFIYSRQAKETVMHFNKSLIANINAIIEEAKSQMKKLAICSNVFIHKENAYPFFDLQKTNVFGEYLFVSSESIRHTHVPVSKLEFSKENSSSGCFGSTKIEYEISGLPISINDLPPEWRTTVKGLFIKEGAHSNELVLLDALLYPDSYRNLGLTDIYCATGRE